MKTKCAITGKTLECEKFNGVYVSKRLIEEFRDICSKGPIRLYNSKEFLIIPNK